MSRRYNNYTNTSLYLILGIVILLGVCLLMGIEQIKEKQDRAYNYTLKYDLCWQDAYYEGGRCDITDKGWELVEGDWEF